MHIHGRHLPARPFQARVGQIGPAMRHDGSVRGALLSRDERRILSWSDDKTLRLWDAAWPEGNILQAACALLPDHDHAGASQRFGITISEPICASKDGLAPIDWSEIERSPPKQ